MNAPTRATLEAQVLCVTRELRLRERVYPRWVESGKMTQRQADIEIAVMSAVLVTLTELEAKERLL